MDLLIFLQSLIPFIPFLYGMRLMPPGTGVEEPSQHSRRGLDKSACDHISDDVARAYKTSSSSFLEGWTKEIRKKHYYIMAQDFPQYFLNTQLKEPWHLKCEIDTGCKNLTSCEDMVEILEDPQEPQHLKDVYYNLQAIGDWFDIAKSAYSATSGLKNQLQSKVDGILGDFSTSNKGMVEQCDATKNTVIVWMQNVVLYLCEKGLIEMEKESVFAIMNEYLANDDVLKLDDIFCNFANEEKNYMHQDINALGPALADQMFLVHQAINMTHTYLKQDSVYIRSVLDSKEAKTLPELIWTSSTLLSDDQRERLEDLEEIKTDLGRLFVMSLSIWVMKQQLAGIFCWRHPEGHCEKDDPKTHTVCIIPEEGIQCRAGAWERVEEDPQLWPLYGWEKMDGEKYEWTYKVLIEWSFDYYKRYGFKEDSMEETTNRYLREGKFDPMSVLHLPVCADLDGRLPLPILRPPDGRREEHGSWYWHKSDLKGDEKTFGCSCGVDGRETRAFWEAMGLYDTPHMYFAGAYELCKAEAARGYNQNNPIDFFLTLCDQVGMSNNIFDPLCEKIQDEYNAIKNRDDVDNKAAACYMIDYSDNWKDMITRDHTAHTRHDMREASSGWQLGAQCADHEHDTHDLEEAYYHCDYFFYGEKRKTNILKVMAQVVDDIDDNEQFSRTRHIAQAWGEFWALFHSRYDYHDEDSFDYEQGPIPITFAMYVRQSGTNTEEDGKTIEKAITGREVKYAAKKLSELCAHRFQGGNITFGFPENDTTTNDPKRFGYLSVDITRDLRGCGEGRVPTLCLHGKTFGNWDTHPFDSADSDLQLALQPPPSKLHLPPPDK